MQRSMDGLGTPRVTPSRPAAPLSRLGLIACLVGIIIPLGSGPALGQDAATGTPDTQPWSEWLQRHRELEYPKSPSLPAWPDAGTVAGWPDVIEHVPSVLAVVDPSTAGYPEHALMRADCAISVWTVAADGTGTEWAACTLSDEPVRIPLNQGVLPAATITYDTGPCQWTSDYWTARTGTDVKASGAEVTVTSTGRVLVVATYPATPLECPSEEPSRSPSPTP